MVYDRGMKLTRLPLAMLALALVSLAGCGSDAPNIGSACSGFQCDEGLTCNLNVSGGYCTKTCVTAGSTSECPEGSVCDDSTGLQGIYCLKICQTGTDCDPTQDCNGIAGSNIKACHPKDEPAPDAGMPDAAP